MRVAHVGVVTAPISNFEQYLPEVKAPSNYKDPDKIRGYIENAKADLLAEAAEFPLTCALKDFCLLRLEHETIQTAAIAKSEPIGHYMDNYDVISCLGVGPLMRAARYDWIAKRGHLTWDSAWLVWNDPFVPRLRAIPPVAMGRIFDPLQVLIGSSAVEASNPILAARRFLGKNIDPATLTTAYGRAELSLQFAALLGVK